jgi:hypothetical protein
LRDPAQVEQLLRYIIEEPPQDAESKRTFKYAAVTDLFSFCKRTNYFHLLPTDYLIVI